MKHALLIGINYIGTSHQLNGCINDVINLKSLLIDHYDYLEENIVVLTDETEKKPTRQNILDELYKLLVKSNETETEKVLISFSGHGTWTIDTNNDELDGRDEMIVPLDFKCIKDDILYNIIKCIEINCECFCLFDSCHSGTIVDLPYQYLGGDFVKENLDVSDPEDIKDIIMISGCKDQQYSQEAYVNRQVQGAMTTIFLFLLRKHNYKISWEKLISEMNNQLALYGYTQQPRLNCNKKIDTTSNVDF
jgi:hypothetical protein